MSTSDKYVKENTVFISVIRRIVFVVCCLIVVVNSAACTGAKEPANTITDTNMETETGTNVEGGASDDSSVREFKASIVEQMDALLESFSVGETWKKVGIENYCDDEYQVPELLAFLDIITENEGDILSLFPAYFNEKFASTEQIETATAIATSFTEYLLDKHGLDFYLEVDEIEPSIIEWLGANNIEFDYNDKFAEQLSKVTIDDHLYYDYVFYTERNERLYCKPTAWIETPFEVRRYIHEYIEGTEAILAGLEKDAPYTYSFIVDNIPNVLEIFFDDGNMGSGQSGGYAGRTQIHLGVDSHPYIVFHELMHIWCFWLTDMERWQSEGFAEYIPLRYYQSPSIKETIANWINDYEHEICFMYKERGYPLESDAADYYLYTQCCAQYEYNHLNDEEPDLSLTLAEVAGIPKGEMRDGDELSYDWAMSFVSYLIDKTSLDDFVKNSSEGIPLIEAYGMDYEELKAAWMRDTFETD